MNDSVLLQPHARNLVMRYFPGCAGVLDAESAFKGSLEVLDLDLDEWQREVISRPSKRDLLNCSRQAGKSTTAAVLGLHEALYRPGSLTILVSPSQRQSSELFRKVIELRGKLSPERGLTEDNKLSMTVKGGGRVLSLPGSEATIRGFSGATLIVEDEASRVDDALYFSIRPMLAIKGGRLILMSTPFGKRGHFWNEWNTGTTWNRVEVPATRVPRISAELLEEERSSLGLWWFEQAVPMPIQGEHRRRIQSRRCYGGALR